ncbi:MAG: glycosyltransferase [Prevotella sp.]
MRILHYHNANDRMTAEYVNILSGAMTEFGYLSGDGCIENVSATSLHDAMKAMNTLRVDIVHFHGCWRDSDFMVARKARKAGTRIVISPHGQLEPWIIKQDYWKSRVPRIIAYQMRIINDAYAVVVMGKMEENCMKRLGWNTRIEVVRNSMITDTITDKEMARKMLDIYNKVMDSHTFALLGEEERLAFASLIKAGVSGDSQWLTDNEHASISRLTPVGWRRILIHAYHTSVSDTIADAIDTLGLPRPDVKPGDISCYLPKEEKRKGLFNKEIKPLPAVIADDRGDYTESFSNFIKSLHKHAGMGHLTIKDIIETAYQMRKVSIDERLFNEEMKAKSLDKFVSSLMQIMIDYTRMEEGFLIAPPKNNRRTRRLAAMLDNEKKILITHHIK